MHLVIFLSELLISLAFDGKTHSDSCHSFLFCLRKEKKKTKTMTLISQSSAPAVPNERPDMAFPFPVFESQLLIAQTKLLNTQYILHTTHCDKNVHCHCNNSL